MLLTDSLKTLNATGVNQRKHTAKMKTKLQAHTIGKYSLIGVP